MRSWMRRAGAGLALLLGGAGPSYTPDGRLNPPADYRTWVFLGAGLDMSYTANAPMGDTPMFDNVFVDPAAWQNFARTGIWPDKTMFALEIRGAASHGSIAKHGYYQSENLMGVELHIRDDARFKGGWGFFQIDGTAPAPLVSYDAACYACHQAHGAAQTTFTQFYPTAKPIAVKAGNYRGD